jgi:hypothetical protein
VLAPRWKRCSQVHRCHACLCHGTPVLWVSCEMVRKGSTGWGLLRIPPHPVQRHSNHSPSRMSPLNSTPTSRPSLTIPVVRRLMGCDVIAASNGLCCDCGHLRDVVSDLTQLRPLFFCRCLTQPVRDLRCGLPSISGQAAR